MRTPRLNLLARFVSLAWAALLPIASAQTGRQSLAPVIPQTLNGPFQISGRVVNSATGEAVRRATLALLAEEDGHMIESVMSDADGHFVLDHLPAGKYPLAASKRGFRTSLFDEHDEFNSAIVTGADQDTTHLVFQLTPGAVLHGVVTGDGGDPVENASVHLFKRQNQGAAQGRSGPIKQAEGTTTDDTGAYEFSNLAPGEYFVAVEATPWYAIHSPSGARQNGTEGAALLDVTYPVTFFDSTADEGSATPIVLAPAGRDQADINMHAVPALRLRVSGGRRGISGMANSELRKMVFGTPISSESKGTNGAFVEFDSVAPGHYSLLQGDPPKVVELDASASQEVDPNLGTPAVSVTGTLRAAGAIALPENLQLVMQPADPANGRTEMYGNARDGHFRFDTVQPGTWNLFALNAGQSLAVSAIAVDGAASAGAQFTVKDRAVTLTASVTLAATRVQGKALKAGKGLSGAMIVLVPRQPSAYRALVRRDQSDSDGSFSLRDAAPGQYTVVAIEDGWKLDWARRDVIEKYLPGGVSVTVADHAGPAIALPAAVLVQAR